MPLFEYRGLNKSGKNVRGTVDADNVRSAKLKLKKDNIYIVEISDRAKIRAARGKGSKSSSITTGIGVEDLAMMTRQLATLLKANIPLVDSLGAVGEQIENPKLSDIINESRNFVNEGGSFNKALQKHPRVFNKVYVSMCEAGEMSGTLDVILLRLAEFTEGQHQLNSKIKSAMIYPVLMLIFITIMLAVLFVYVIPKITDIFDSFPELVLPWYSKVVIDLSDTLVNYWHVMTVAVVAVFFMFLSWKNSTTGQKQYDHLILKLPIIGPMVRLIAVSRFAKTLATLLVGGVPMISAMNIVRNVVNNETIGAAIDQARDNINEGESIAGPLKQSGQFPPLVLHMINIGEKTGDLENMLTQVSDAYDYQVKSSVDGLTSLLEPVMLIIMGLVIGTIVFAIMIPIFELSSIGG